jgi:hypothetical protein
MNHSAPLRKRIRANAEYLRILLSEFRVTLLLLAGILVLGSLFLHFFRV